MRELANVVERAVITSTGPVLRIPNLAEALPVATQPQLRKTLEEMEREYIIAALEDASWRLEGQAGAAGILGLSPDTLRARMRKLGVVDWV